MRLSFVNEASQLIKKLGGNLNETLNGIGLRYKNWKTIILDLHPDGEDHVFLKM